MYLDSFIQSECTGCGACEEKCPVGAITMKMTQGFFYPVIDKNKCIHCNLCRSICKNIFNIFCTNDNIIDNIKCFYGWNMDEEQRMRSTSGGAFPAIVKMWLDLHPGAWIYGAVYDDAIRVVHKGVRTMDDVQSMCRSKYVQSNMTGIFSDIINKLERKEYVLFSGTPCQVAALKSIVGNKSEFLMTVDLVCHGVLSPMLFDKYLAQLSINRGQKVKSYSFRNKYNKFLKKSLRMIKTEFDDGYVKVTENDLLIMAYKNRLFYRLSCFNCPYASTIRVADFTIGDFWGIENRIPKLKTERIKGISMVMLNNYTACSLENKLCEYMDLNEIELETVNYGQMVCPTQKPTIQIDYNKLEFENDIIQMLKKYLPMKKRLIYLFPSLTKFVIKIRSLIVSMI